MSKNTSLYSLFGLAAGLVLIGQGCFQPAKPPAASAPVVPATSAPTVVETAPAGRTVEFVDGGFSPNELVVESGATVTFINKTDTPVWPASAPHPVHTDLFGFDALKGLVKGETYSFTFTTVGEWKYHNHLSPGATGKIIVR